MAQSLVALCNVHVQKEKYIKIFSDAFKDITWYEACADTLAKLPLLILNEKIDITTTDGSVITGTVAQDSSAGSLEKTVITTDVGPMTIPNNSVKSIVRHKEK